MTHLPSNSVSRPLATTFARAAGSAAEAMGIAGPADANECWAADAYHGQRTPGAYEWWRFDAVNDAGNGVVVMLFDGLPFYPLYQSNASRWHRRLAKSHFDVPHAEALPSYYPAAYMGVYQGGQRVTQFLNLYPPGSFEGSMDLPNISVGPNHITLRADGSFGIVARGYPFDVHGGTPRPRTDQVLSADLNFMPTANGVQHIRPLRPPGPDNAAHTWVLAAPHGRMTGRVQHLALEDDVALMDAAVDCVGYHDHAYGQGALGLQVQRLAMGHFVGPDFTLVWQRTVPRDKSQARTDGIMVFEKDSPPVVIDAPQMRADQFRFTRWFLRYPSRATHYGSDTQGNSVELLLQHSAVIDGSPFHARLVADASLNIMGRRRYTGRGATTILYLRRLRWPLLSDVVLMSILPVAADDPLWRQ